MVKIVSARLLIRQGELHCLVLRPVLGALVDRSVLQLWEADCGVSFGFFWLYSAEDSHIAFEMNDLLLLNFSDLLLFE